MDSTQDEALREREAETQSYPLTPTQQGILINSLRTGEGLVEIEQIVARLEESVDITLLRAAWQWAAQRHDALRTSFRWDGDLPPRQVAVPKIAMPIETRDQSRLGESQQEAELARFLEEDRERGFDLGKPPLSRLTLFIHGPVDHVLVWTFHHALLDGRSFTTILREVFERYDASRRGEAYDPPAPPPFRAHCEYIAQRDTLPERSFWTERLRGFSTPTPIPTERTDRASAPKRRRHDEIEARVGSDAIVRLVAVGKEHGFTLANAVQGAWALVLARYANTTDVCFGSTRAARRTSAPNAMDMVGCLINTVPLRVEVDGDGQVATWLATLHDLNTAIRPYEQASLVSMKGWAEVDPNVPLFETLVVFERYLMDSELRALGGAAFEHRHFSVLEQSDFPLVLAAYQDGSELVVKLEHDPTRCDPDAVARLLGHVTAILGAFAEHPHAKLRELRMLTSDEREELLDLAGGDGPMLQAFERIYFDAFRSRVRESPEAIAIVFEGHSISYRELDRMASAITARIEDEQVGRGDVVAVCLRRSPLWAAAMIGIMRRGAVYLPIDPGLPADRIAMLLADSKARAILIEKATEGALGSAHAPTRVRLDEKGALEREPRAAIEIDPEWPAYLLYTSGSTGKPKGVLIPHRALFAHARAVVPAYGLTSADRCYQFTSQGFDVSLEETFTTWLAGGTVVLRSELAASSLETFLREVADKRITVLNLPSAFFSEVALHLHERQGSMHRELRLMVVGGEKPSSSAYARWTKKHPDMRFVNAYGPTEVTITSTYCDPREADVAAHDSVDLPIGRPLGATRAYIVDRSGDLAPIGVPGELCLAGPQVALGYLEREEASRDRFVPDPFAGTGTMYRTGDLVRWLASGQLEFAGRIDDQIKIRGFRIEPGEIEAALRAEPGVRDAIVMARPDRTGTPQLVAWIVGDANLPLDSIRERLTRVLPSYMVPRAILRMAAFPTTRSGKIDRRALPEPESSASSGDFVAPQGDLEAWIASLYAELLGRDRISAEDNFFDLGGQSLLAIRLLSKINARAKESIPLSTIFANATVRELARTLTSGGSAHVPTLVALNRADPKALPFFCICGVQLYARLARAMEADRRVFGAFLPIETDALMANGQVNLDVPAMASAYIALVREQRPQGPYLLGGVSFGGVLAYEMAQQLRAEGETVALLCLFDAILPRALIKASAMERARAHVKRLAESPRAFADHLSERIRRHVTRLTGSPLAVKGASDNGALNIGDLDLWRDELFFRAAKDYDQVVKPYEGKVVLFRARDGLGHEGERVEWDLGWSGLVAAGTATHVVEGTHLGILGEPGVFEIARSLRQHLREFDERPPMRRTRRVSSARIRISVPPTEEKT